MGYENMANLSDVELDRPVLPAGTEVTLTLTRFELSVKDGKQPAFRPTFEVADGENEGYQFTPSWSCNDKLGTNDDGTNKKASGFDITRRNITQLLAGILSSKEDVDNFFAGIAHDPANPAGTLVQIRDTMQAVVGQQLHTRLGVKPAQGQWPAAQTLGTVTILYRQQPAQVGLNGQGASA